MSFIESIIDTFFNRLVEKHNYNSDILNSEWNILNNELKKKIKETTIDSLVVSLDKLSVKDDEPTYNPTRQPTRQSTDQSTGQSIRQSTLKPIPLSSQSTSQSTFRFASRSSQSTSQPSESTSEPTSEPFQSSEFSQPSSSTSESTSESTYQPTSQSSQTTSQSTSQPKPTCPYKMIRGVHANTICNGRVKIGHVVCSKHIKYEAQYLNTSNSPPQSPKIVNKSRAKIITKTPIVNVDIINTCKTAEDEQNCINFDSMQVHEINQLYRDLFKCDFDVYKDRNMSLEEIFWDKKRKLVDSIKDKPIKITLIKWNQIEHSSEEIISMRTRNNVILNLVKYKQSGYWVDKNSLVIIKSVEDPIVIGRINRYEQPTLHIDGYTYDLILQYNFEFDFKMCNDEGKEAHEAFLNSNNLKVENTVSDDTLPQDGEILL